MGPNESEAAGTLVGMLCTFGCMGLFFLLILGFLALWIWMLIDCIQNEPSEGNDKIVWLLVIVLLQGIGALIYYFARRPKRKQLYGK